MASLNAEKYLPELLKSLARQSLQPCELVVCDDGSSDNTLKLAEDFARQVAYPVRVFRNEKRLRPAKNFEKAMSLCHGELIALCDQDDVWYPQKLATLARNLQAAPGAGGIFSDADLIDETSAGTGETLWHRAMFRPARDTVDSRILLRGNVVTGATLMVRSARLDQLLPVPGSWIHDGWIAWMLVLRSQLLVCRERLIGYRIHTSQQVGMPQLSPRVRLRRARESGARDYSSLEAQFSDLLAFARAHPEICDESLCRSIEEKRKHSHFRADLQPNRWARWLEIMARRSGYRRYAQGWRSMLKDALL